LRAWDLWPIRRSDICLRIRISALFKSIRRWLNGRSLGAGKCHRSLGGKWRDAYFHDFEPGERRYHHRPGRPPNLRRPGLVRFREVYFDLEADSLAFNVRELPEGLLGDIDGIIVGLRRGNVHQSRGIGIGDDVGGSSSSRCGA